MQGKGEMKQDIIGKTITAAIVMKLADFDDKGFLKLEFSDGTSCVIVADYGGYTGESQKEYQTAIHITDDADGACLIPCYPQ